MKTAVLMLFCIFTIGCASSSNKTMVLSYNDFGPQVAAYETIGMDLWQWDQQGVPDSSYQYHIKVVVYRDILLKEVMDAYPVVKEKEQDYRYLPYSKAMAYLNREIQADIFPALTKKLSETKSKIESNLKKPN